MAVKRFLPLLIVLFFVGSLIPTPPPASARLLGLSLKDEEQMGKDFSEELSKEYRVTQNERITRLGNRVAQVTGMEGRVTFHLIDMGKEDEPNSFQIPGNIYVTRSLDAMLNDDQLTFVMGHEMGHQVMHHLRRQIEREQKTQLWMLAIGLALPIPGAILSLSESGINSKFSRKQEIQADRFGYLVTKQLGINVEVAVDAFKKIMTEKAPPKYVQELFGSHPLLNQRTSRLEAAAAAEQKPPVAMAYSAGGVVFSPESLAKLDAAAIPTGMQTQSGVAGTVLDCRDCYLRVMMLSDAYSENLTTNLTTSWKVPAIWYVRSVSQTDGGVKVSFSAFVPGKGRATFNRQARGDTSTPWALTSLTTQVVGKEVAGGDMSKYHFGKISPY